MLVLLLLWETVLRTSSSRESKVSQSLFRTPDHCWATYPRGCGIWEVGGSSLRARKQHSYWHKILPGKSAVETTNANLWAYPRRESDFLAYVSSPSFPTNQSHIKKSSVVSGDHTRSIQIATPTVGGLMKFAVKTVTCLGCKTALRSNNSVQSVSFYSFLGMSDWVGVCQMVPFATTAVPRYPNYIKNKWRWLPNCKYDSLDYGHNARDVKVPYIRYELLFLWDIWFLRRNWRMSCVRVRIVLYTTCEKRPRRMLKTRMECWSVLMKRCGDIDVFMTWLRIYNPAWIDTLFDIPRVSWVCPSFVLRAEKL